MSRNAYAGALLVSLMAACSPEGPGASEGLADAAIPDPTVLYEGMEGVGPMAIEDRAYVAELDEYSPGATLTFFATTLENGALFDDLRINASSDDLHLVHPLFVVWNGARATPDPLDRFADVDDDIRAGTSSRMGEGSIILTRLQPDSKISIHFETLETSRDTSDEGECLDLSGFQSRVVPTLQDTCASCHAGSLAAASAAMDLSLLETDEQSPVLCIEILDKTTPENPAESDLLKAVDPALSNGHPLKLDARAFEQFQSDVLAWLAEEGS